MLITMQSRFSGKTHTLDLPVTPEQVAAFNAGALVQDAFPHLTAEQREFFVTGATPEEWEQVFPSAKSVADLARRFKAEGETAEAISAALGRRWPGVRLEIIPECEGVCLRGGHQSETHRFPLYLGDFLESLGDLAEAAQAAGPTIDLDTPIPKGWDVIEA
jgi:hypothetical protein